MSCGVIGSKEGEKKYIVIEGTINRSELLQYTIVMFVTSAAPSLYENTLPCDSSPYAAQRSCDRLFFFFFIFFSLLLFSHKFRVTFSHSDKRNSLRRILQKRVSSTMYSRN